MVQQPEIGKTYIWHSPDGYKVRVRIDCEIPPEGEAQDIEYEATVLEDKVPDKGAGGNVFPKPAELFELTN